MPRPAARPRARRDAGRGRARRAVGRARRVDRVGHGDRRRAGRRRLPGRAAGSSTSTAAGGGCPTDHRRDGRPQAAYDDPAALGRRRARSAPARRSTALAARRPAPVVFLALHGPFGEDGTVQALLRGGRPRLHGLGRGGVARSAWTRRSSSGSCRGLGLPVVDWREVRAARWARDPDARPRPSSRRSPPATGDPRLMVKPARPRQLGRDDPRPRRRRARRRARPRVPLRRRSRSSSATSRAPATSRSRSSATSPAALELYGPGEIVSGHEFYDYAAKYTPGPVRDVDHGRGAGRSSAPSILKLARDAYRAIGGEGFARVDFLLAGERARRSARSTRSRASRRSACSRRCRAAGGYDFAGGLPAGRRPRPRAPRRAASGDRLTAARPAAVMHAGRRAPASATGSVRAPTPSRSGPARGPAAASGGRGRVRARPPASRRSAPARCSRSSSRPPGSTASTLVRRVRARARRRSTGATLDAAGRDRGGARRARRARTCSRCDRRPSRRALASSSPTVARRDGHRRAARTTLRVAARRARGRSSSGRSASGGTSSTPTATPVRRARRRRRRRPPRRCRSSTTGGSTSAALGVGSTLDPVDARCRAPARLARRRPTSAARPERSRHGSTTRTASSLRAGPAGWNAIFGFYTPTLRTTELIPGQVRLLRSLLAGARGDVAAGHPRRRATAAPTCRRRRPTPTGRPAARRPASRDGAPARRVSS